VYENGHIKYESVRILLKPMKIDTAISLVFASLRANCQTKKCSVQPQGLPHVTIHYSVLKLFPLLRLQTLHRVSDGCPDRLKTTPSAMQLYLPAGKQALHLITTYSVRSDFTGFATAAFIAWKLTVINAINTVNTPAVLNIHQLIFIL
jgi:hypothetical protein